MINYIRAEVYRTRKNKSYKMLVLVVSILAVALVMLATLANKKLPQDITIENLFEYSGLFRSIKSFMTLGVFIVYFFINIIMELDFRNKTIKNIYGMNLSRKEIIISKFIASLEVGLRALLVILASYFISGFLLFPKGSLNLMAELKELGLVLLGGISLWSGAMAVLLFSVCLLEDSKSALLYYGIVGIIPKGLAILGGYLRIDFLNNIYIKLGLYKRLELLDNVGGEMIKSSLHGIVVGLIYVLVFLYLSTKVLERKDL